MNYSKLLKLLSAVCLMAGLNFACFQDKVEQQNAYSINDYTQDSLSIADNEEILLWEYDAQGDSMIKHDIPDDININAIVESFNTRYDSISLDVVRVSRDTVFLKIENASYLSQRMGSTGANGYMSELVYSLTEIPGIDLIHLDFEVGDHASPGVYSRDSFNTKL